MMFLRILQNCSEYVGNMLNFKMILRNAETHYNIEVFLPCFRCYYIIIINFEDIVARIRMTK